MPPEPTSLSRIGLDVVREGHAQFYLGFSELFQFGSWPRELMEIHVPGLDAAVLLPEQLEFIFRYPRKIVRSAKDCAAVICDSVSVFSQQGTLLVLSARRIEMSFHGWRPLCRMHH